MLKYFEILEFSGVGSWHY